MKQTKVIFQFFGLLLLFIVFFFSACKKENIQDPSASHSNYLIQKVVDMGFRKDMIEDKGDYFLVENDIVITKDNLIQGDYDYSPPYDYGSQSERQARTNGLVNRTNVTNITVRVDNSIPTTGIDNWRAEVQQAIQDWNNAGSEVNMVFTTAATADITVRSDFNVLGNNTIADALIPSGGNPGNRIRINLNFNNNQNIPTGQKRYNMVHELGHCVGLHHTNWSSLGEGNATHINGTPTTDGNSVMNGGTAGNTWNGLSVWDIVAIQTLYPTCPSGFSYDGANCHSGVYIPTGYDGFIYGNAFYVEPNCCPSGFTYDGANCHSGTYIPSGYNPFIYGNAFYVEPNCSISSSNNCCPSGYTYDGANCHSGVYFPSNYDAFIYGNAFYVKSNNTGCSDCPPGYTFDGANCHSGVYFPSNCTDDAFIWGNAFYVHPNCE